MFQCFGTKELKPPVFCVPLSIPMDVQKKICSVAAVEAYLSRTSDPVFHHGDPVWCSLKPSKKDGIYKAVGPETLSRWMRTVMDICKVPKPSGAGPSAWPLLQRPSTTGMTLGSSL